jgi:very-short-patch-repair endonuclease
MQADKHNNLAYNADLRPFAYTLRQTFTKAEACLWKYALRAGQMKGYTFRRQRPVLGYIADFMCQPLMLIIEVDGGIHKDDLVAAKDQIRQKELEAAGFTVLRFENEMVLHRMAEVKLNLEMWIEDYERVHGVTPKLRKAS